MIQWDEKDLEDWLCSPAREGEQWRLWDVLSDAIPQQGRPRMAMRQVPLGDMKADIVLAWPDYIAVVELKAKPATGDDLAQVLHYESWLNARVWHTHFAEEVEGGAPDVLAYLIAPSFSERLYVAARSTRVRLHRVELVWTIREQNFEELVSLDSAEHDDAAACDRAVNFATFGTEDAPSDEGEQPSDELIMRAFPETMSAETTKA